MTLKVNNYLNIIGFVINAFVTFGATPILRIPGNQELSLKYQTIITPDGLTFAIWGIIFLSEGIFAILQMLPSFRSLKIVQDGIGYWYFAACLSQSAWVLAFGYEILTLSLLFMGLILISLFRIITIQDNISSSGIKEYWGFRFPFQIHCAWIFAAFALSINVIVVSRNDSEMLQAAFGALSLLAFIMIAVYSAYGFKGGSSYTIPAVFAWALFGIFRELHNPSENLEKIFSANVISVFMISSAILCIVMLCIIIFLVIKSCKEHYTSPDQSLDDESDDHPSRVPLL